MARARPELSHGGASAGGEGGQGGGDAQRDGLEDAVGQALFEVGEAVAEDLGKSGGDARDGQQELVHVAAAHHAR
ncbi:hypothetical protein [Streptomyces sp. NBC_01092]|uniref:hypothetical protein n=1 Tax=Streptomyces sp. NBC_01092 TaxID=2903748 RepID=UPI00386C7655|nr:hypothetical protein OG254_06945 [Streptomyces sp. NBC_01092]